jgi:L-seryl-tRNA(Ser) seleniumtransferase
MYDNPYRLIPSVNDIVQNPVLAALLGEHAPDAVSEAVRLELADLRDTIRDGKPAVLDPGSIAARAVQRLRSGSRPKLRPVINATGIVLHTNLGRAPLAEVAARAATEAAAGYLNLELDLQTGKRSSRQDAIREWVCRLTGAESATAVNNNAAATVIALRALAAGKEVIVSRGQLVEIGGSFRIPDIMAVSGAVLREVGTTNITRISDYERAVTPQTAALLRVHCSNYRVHGHTEAATLEEMVAVGRRLKLPIIDDIGSGALVPFEQFGFTGEPLARTSLATGADLVLFSGDKLLGGPQAGILAGRKEWVSRVERDPLMRAFRLDKMTLAALEATLRLYLNEARAFREIPVLRMLNTPLTELRQRAESLAVRLRAVGGIASVIVTEDDAYVGGGSLPDQAMKTYVLEVVPAELSDEALSLRLRTGDPAVLGRLRSGKLILDIRTVFPTQEESLTEAVTRATRVTR